MARHGVDWVFAMALYSLGHFFGDDWVKRHLFEGGFLKPPACHVDRETQQRVGMQGHFLAEALFNFQEYENFGGIHARLLKGEVEPCVGELEAAHFLAIRGKTIRFRKSQGIFGQDFDLEWLAEDRVICCETETKLEANTLEVNRVWKTLDHARQQLPKLEPGVIFLRVIGHSAQEELEATGVIVRAAAERLFRQSRRLLAVVLLTRFYCFEGNTLKLWPAWSVMINPGSAHPSSLVEGIQGNHTGVPADWTELARYKPRFVFDWA